MTATDCYHCQDTIRPGVVCACGVELAPTRECQTCHDEIRHGEKANDDRPESERDRRLRIQHRWGARR